MQIAPLKPPAAVALQDLLVVVLRASEDEAALRAAEEICASSGGRATALLASPFQTTYFVGDVYGGGADAWTAILTELRKDAANETALLKERLSKNNTPIALRTIENDPLQSRQYVLMSARHADIAVFTRPTEGLDQAVREDLIEAALFESGRPVLIVPPDYSGPMAFKNILVAWNGSREAARAVGDGAPLIDGAERVTVVTIDAIPSTGGVGEAPGADIAAHLARRGARVELRNVDGLGRPVGDCILEASHSVGADLIILGAYGHARMREIIFGGATRHMLRKTDTPLFLSH